MTVAESASVHSSCVVDRWASVLDQAHVTTRALILEQARVTGHARVYRSTITGHALITDRASISNGARIAGHAVVCDGAQVTGRAIIKGSGVTIGGQARITGNARIATRTDVAWVDRVGSGNPMTLHRTKTGWRINAGCQTWDAPTIRKVVGLVRVNTAVEVDHPVYWDGEPKRVRRRYAQQVTAALDYLESMVKTPPKK